MREIEHILNLARQLALAVMIVVAAGFVACSSDEGEVTLLGPNEAEHTLIMYLIADNNLSSSIYQNAIDAEEGMIGAMPQSRLVIYLDNATETTLYEVSYKSYGSNEHIRYCEKLKKYPKQTCTTPEVMQQVLEDVKRLVPSRSYGLAMACHGSGWFPKPSSGTSYNEQKVAPEQGSEYDFMPLMDGGMTRSLGWDYVRDDMGGCERTDESYLSTADVVRGLSPIHFEYIIFDACLMSSVEFLYEIRDCADYVVASPVEILACGLPYKDIVEHIMSPGRDVTELGEIVMDVYMRDNSFTSLKSLAIAVIDCSELEPLTESVAAIYSASKQEDVFTTVEQLVDMENVQVLDRMNPAAFYDLDDYVGELTDDVALLADFREALGRAVVYASNTEDINSLGYAPDGMAFGYNNIEMKVGGALNLCGLSCYVPRRSAPITYDHYMQTGWAQRVYGAE